MIDKNTLDLAREWAENLRNAEHPRPIALAAAEVIAALPDEWIDANKVREVIKRTPTWEDSAQAENLLCLLLDELRALLPTPTPRTLADMTEEEREACRFMAAEVVTGRTWFIIGENPARPGWWIVVTRSGRIESRLPEHITPLPDLPRMVWPDGEQEADDTREPEQAPDHPTELVAEDDYRGAPNGTVVWGGSPAYGSPTSLEKWYDLWRESGVTNSYGEGAMAECGPHQVLRLGGAQ